MAGACDWLSLASSPSDWLLGRAPEAGAALAAESPLPGPAALCHQLVLQLGVNQ